MTELPTDPTEDLSRARRGDPAAIQRLLSRNEVRLRRLAEARLGRDLRGRVRISDVLQSTYVEVLKGGFRGETEQEFSNYVLRTLENNIRDKGKYFGAAKRRHDEVDDDVSNVEPAGLEATPSVELSRIEDIDAVHAALQELPEDYRTIIRLRCVECLSHEQAAAAMGRSETAARSLFHRAKAALLAKLQRSREDRGTGG